MLKASRGFSIIEIMIVMGIVGVIVAGIWVFVIGGAGEANIDRAKAQIAQISTKIELYSVRKGGIYPPDLRSTISSGDVEKEMQQFNDPWGVPFNYQTPGTHNPTKYDLWSNGPDRTPNTADDIGNW